MDKGQLSNIQQLKYGSGEYATSVYDDKTGRWIGNGYNATGNGYNATGNDNWRGGLTWVGEAGPELVRLPQHAQILSNQESRALAGGDQHIVINVQGIEQLDQVVRWYTSMQTRERMR
jgi:hypothetical protein